jgi:hypothetical protein
MDKRRFVVVEIAGQLFDVGRIPASACDRSTTSRSFGSCCSASL